jgi:hypothetical protein
MTDEGRNVSIASTVSVLLVSPITTGIIRYIVDNCDKERRKEDSSCRGEQKTSTARGRGLDAK